MKTHELIEKLQEADPEGLRDVQLEEDGCWTTEFFEVKSYDGVVILR